MKRTIDALKDRTFDVVIIGGGIYGAALAREAASRGLSTALVEQADFCSGTSANSLKIVHGGLRYLQQADIPRVLESIRERHHLLKCAPHLVSPMPCMMPTRGLAMKSRPVMALGMLANDIISFNRNAGLDPQRRIPMGSTISRERCLEMLPSMRDEPVTGAAVWHDALALDSERLVIGMIKAAAEAGAVVANYVQARRFIMEGNRVTGITAQDLAASDSAPFPVCAGMVINAAGPWEPELLASLGRPVAFKSTHLALAMNIIIRNWPVTTHAVGLQSKGNGRLYFFVPWRGVTMAGTYYRSHRGPADSLTVTDEDINAYLDALNACLPDVRITREDILAVHAGILPCRQPPLPDQEPRLLRHYRFVDHARTDGIAGLVSVLGIKYTTARGVAETVIGKLAPQFNKPPQPSRTAQTPLPGGNMANRADFIKNAAIKYPDVPADIRERLLAFYGTEAEAIFKLAAEEALPLSDPEALLRAEIRFVIRHEMPLTLGDVLYRRTGMASAGAPAEQPLRIVAEVMAAEYDWDAARTQAEIQNVRSPATCWQAGCLKPPSGDQRGSAPSLPVKR